MTDPLPSKKKRDQPKQALAAQAGKAHKEGRQHAAGSSGVFKLLSAFVLLAAVVVAYRHDPTLFTDFLDSWIGFSEHWEGSQPATSTNNPVHLSADIPKRNAVVAAFRHSWLAYEKDAMGDDEYHPISHKGSNLTSAGGIGYTVVDSIDTMLLMGLEAEYARARSWIADKLSFERDGNFNTFETTIRVLGGLLSAYHLSSGDPVYLDKATELADRILPVFETPSGLPHPMINLAKGVGVANADFTGLVSTAEVATLQLEFRYLSHLTGNDDYWRRVENAMRIIKSARLPHGLASIFMSVDEGQYVTSAIRLGSRGDSYYEYLLKQYLQTNGSEPVYSDMYEDAMTAIHNHLVQKSTKSGMTYTAELIPEKDASGEVSWRLTPKQDHLVCFLAGSLMLGATKTGALAQSVSVPPRDKELTPSGRRDWKTGVELLRTCMSTHDTATGLSPEIVHFRIPSDGMDHNSMAPADWYIKGARQVFPFSMSFGYELEHFACFASPGEFPPYDARYMLRYVYVFTYVQYTDTNGPSPETVESLFLSYRLTGDQLYRDHGWNIFQSIEKHCRLSSGGYATIVNVDEVPVRHEDKMETFWMSETLKYLYLLFDDSNTLPLDKYVFNTEAHPLPIFQPSVRTGFS
ncbi:putative glycosyl hydrolase 47 family protein [Lyophyllum shimeji]|uniref:alpha-1,2-Mannosidase n=1 Tax=Lyophyllum shimeji TaxID=47721 RepID=A0A9P3USH4_LYOSH|nr:putative glycosyl hydrolase 47 family protein [Lyophyllum shimeji]